MERPFENIAAINNKKDFWKLAVRVQDKWTVVKDGKEHLELIIVDAKGSDIQVVIPTEYKAVYDKVLLENTTYTLTNFQVQNNDLAFKASEHKHKLKWTGGTDVVDVGRHDIPKPTIKFKPFAEIVSGKWRADLLVHAIGMVHDMGYCQLNEGTGKKLQVNFGLKDLSDISINCTLWEEYAAKFIQFNKDRKDGGPVIVMLNYCKIKEEGRFPLSVSNTYSFTKLFINENIAEINAFRESLPKEEQLLSSSSQLLCSQSYSITQVATEDDLLSKSMILPLSQVIQLDQITYAVTIATIEKVNSTKNGWYYFACHKCPKLAKGDKPPYTCDDGHNTETEIVRYKLEMDVSYDLDKAVFVVWDREVAAMLGVSAAQLRNNQIQAGVTNRLEFPMIMDDLAGKTFVFKVKWQPRWKSCSVVCFKEGTAFINQVRAKFPNIVEPEPEPDIQLLGDDAVMENTTSNPTASNDNVTISTHDLSATSEYDPDTLSQVTPISSFKNAGHPMNCESLSQLTPGSFNSAAGKGSQQAGDDNTPHKHVVIDVGDNVGGHNEITPAEHSCHAFMVVQCFLHREPVVLHN